MAQPLYALLAVLLLGTFSLNQSRTVVEIHGNTMSREIERAAFSAARSTMREIERFDFDSADVGRTTIRQDTLGLSRSLGPETATEADDPLLNANDVDDFDGYVSAQRAAVGASSYPIDVSVEVDYVDPTDPEVRSAVPTLAKAITVRVFEGGPARARRPAEVVLTRVVTPAAIVLH